MSSDDSEPKRVASARDESVYSLPLSPHSLSQSDLFASHFSEDCAAYKTHDSGFPHPSALHLKPVTWESLKEIDFPPSEHYDVVDGLLVWVPMAHGTTLHQKVLTGFVLLVGHLRSWYATSNVDLEVEFINGSSTKVLKSGDRDVNRRGPDVVVLRDHSASSESSSESRESQGQEKCVLRTKERPPYAVIEVTSENTRANDLTGKWIQYALTGIQFYYIIDLSYFENSKEAYVVVGSLEPFEDALKCGHGSPKTLPSSWNETIQVTYEKIYYKKVYRGDEIVKAGIFKDVVVQ